jgi:Ca2+:H+ antiporter
VKIRLHPLLTPSINWLLLALPLAFVFRFVPSFQNETLLFVFSGIAIVPLAGWMSRATDHLAERTGPGLGGLLNATFGNMPELIIAVMALRHGLIGVVKASITGSLIGNILLVLGSAILIGGIRYPHQYFNKTAARATATSLALAAIGLIIPSVFHVVAQRQGGGGLLLAQQHLSLAISGVLLGTYLLWLIFTLVTHKGLFAKETEEKNVVDCGKDKVWPLRSSLIALGLATFLLAIMSEFFSGSVEAAGSSLGLKEAFIGIIIIAVIGNAAEFLTTVSIARKNKMDLSLSIAMGSSLQIALFVTPVLVFASSLLGQPMSLEFTLPEIAAIVLAVGIAILITGDGECSWIEGVQLISVYLILAILFFFLPDPKEIGKSHTNQRPPLHEGPAVHRSLGA